MAAFTVGMSGAYTPTHPVHHDASSPHRTSSGRHRPSDSTKPCNIDIHFPDGERSQPTLQKRYDFFHKVITNPSIVAQIQLVPFLASQPASQPASFICFLILLILLILPILLIVLLIS